MFDYQIFSLALPSANQKNEALALLMVNWGFKYIVLNLKFFCTKLNLNIHYQIFLSFSIPFTLLKSFKIDLNLFRLSIFSLLLKLSPKGSYCKIDLFNNFVCITYFMFILFNLVLLFNHDVDNHIYTKSFF